MPQATAVGIEEEDDGAVDGGLATKKKKPTTKGSCRCGSLSHKWVGHQECRLNPRNAQNLT
jgi:hypothetical protein